MLLNKKGEITTSFLVSILILVVSVAVIVLIYLQFNFDGQIDDLTCKESVVLRGTLASTIPDSMGSIAQGLVPLKCKTEKICISADKKDKCEKTFGSAKDIQLKIVSSDLEIEQILAQELVSCWSMMGEGKLSLFSPSLAYNFGGIGEISSSCVLCSRIAYDYHSLEDNGIDLSKVNLINYMKGHKMPGKEITYYDYMVLSDGNTKIDSSITSPVLKDLKGEEISLVDYDLPEEDMEMAFLFMQVSSPSGGEVFMNTVKAVGLSFGTSVAMSPLKTISKATSFVTNKWVLLIGALAVGAQQINVHKKNAAAFGYCDEFQLEGKEGVSCSAVRVVKYDLGGLSEVCGNIESIG